MRECHGLCHPAISIFSAVVLFGVNKSDTKVAKQNQAGQMKVNLIACKLGFSPVDQSVATAEKR